MAKKHRSNRDPLPDATQTTTVVHADESAAEEPLAAVATADADSSSIEPSADAPPAVEAGEPAAAEVAEPPPAPIDAPLAEGRVQNIGPVEVVGPPTIESVFRDLANHPPSGPPTGYRSNRPNVILTADQSAMQFRIYEALVRQGKTFRNQGEIYGWLLDQIAASLQPCD